MTKEELLQIIEQAAKNREVQLDLSASGITEIPAEIGQLTWLTSLNLKENQLTSLPPEIGQLSELKRLYLSSNKLTSLPSEIGQLVNLERLFLSKNKLTSLPPEIGQLSQLELLYLSDNELTSLPPEIEQLAKLSNLDLKKNRLAVPPEILENIHKPKLIIRYCLQDNPEENDAFKQAKLILLGDKGVGKTSLLKLLMGEEFSAQETPTQAISIKSWSLPENEQNIPVNVWDLSGEEINENLHPFFFSARTLYLLVVDVQQKSPRLEYWLKIIKNQASDSPVIIVGNKTDLGLFNIDRGRLSNKYKNIKAFVETSCQTNQGIEEFKKIISRETKELPQFKEQIPFNRGSVKENLETLPQGYISYSEYEKICQNEGITSEKDQKHLLSLLQDLGVILSFKNHAWVKDNNIINPEWFINWIYYIWQHGYPANTDPFLLETMNKLEIGFQDENQEEFIIPSLFIEERPTGEDWESGLKFQYQYNFLPITLLSRFIVRMKKYIYQNNYWQDGVMLTDKNNIALIKAWREQKKIVISIKGAEETRENFLQTIRDQFEIIHNTMPELEAKELQETVSAVKSSENVDSSTERNTLTEPKPTKADSKLKIFYFVGLAILMALVTVISSSANLPAIPIAIIVLVLGVSIFGVWQWQQQKS